MSKKEMIKNGDDVSLDNGNVTVLNGVSVAEKAKLEEKPEESEGQEIVVESPLKEGEIEVKEPAPFEPTPESEQEASIQIPTVIPDATPEIPVAPIDLTGINISDGSTQEDTTVYPDISSKMPEVSSPAFGEIADQNPFNASNQPYETKVGNQDYNSEQQAFTNSFNSQNAVMLGNGGEVFKTSQDVDAAFERFMNDIRSSYEENIVNPTKTLVDFVNRFINWGNQVTANGLNRRLFDEYDELMELLRQQKSYNGNSDQNFNLDSNTPDYNNSGTYGDDQFGNGFFK